jgi:hypothetical protein
MSLTKPMKMEYGATTIVKFCEKPLTAFDPHF